MSIFLIRHAESEANINGKTLSHASIALSEDGHKQAQALCSKLPRIDHVIVSQYLRTHQTAAPLLEKYNLSFEVDEHLHEFSYLSERKCANTNMDDRKAWVNAYWEKWIISIKMPMMQNLLKIYIYEFKLFMKS